MIATWAIAWVIFANGVPQSYGVYHYADDDNHVVLFGSSWACAKAAKDYAEAHDGDDLEPGQKRLLACLPTKLPLPLPNGVKEA